MAFSNRDKTIHGRDAQYSLDTILKLSKEENYVAEFAAPYRAGCIIDFFTQQRHTYMEDSIELTINAFCPISPLL